MQPGKILELGGSRFSSMRDAETPVTAGAYLRLLSEVTLPPNLVVGAQCRLLRLVYMKPDEQRTNLGNARASFA